MSPEGNKEQKQQVIEERRSLVVPREYIDEKNGHLGYLGFPHLLAEIHVDWMARKGIVFEDFPEKYGASCMVRAMSVEYDKELLPLEFIEVATRAELGDSSITFDQAIFNAKKEIAGTAKFTIVLVKEGRAVSLPAEVREAFLKEPKL